MTARIALIPIVRTQRFPLRKNSAILAANFTNAIHLHQQRLFS